MRFMKSVLMKQTNIVKTIWIIVNVFKASHQGVFGYPMNFHENLSARSSTKDAYSISLTLTVPTALLIEANFSCSPNSKSSLTTNDYLLTFF